MFPFNYATASDESDALTAGADGAHYLAGGTTLVDLMRQTVERPERVSTSTPFPTATSTSPPPGCAWVAGPDDRARRTS